MIDSEVRQAHRLPMTKEIVYYDVTHPESPIIVTDIIGVAQEYSNGMKSIVVRLEDGRQFRIMDQYLRSMQYRTLKQLETEEWKRTAHNFHTLR